MKNATLVKVAVGWAAIHDVSGNRWAVHAATEEEALRLYAEGIEKRREIATRPYNFELLDNSQYQQTHV